MKKLILTITAFLCATFAFAESVTKADSHNESCYLPKTLLDGTPYGSWGSSSLYLGVWDGYYSEYQVWEFALSDFVESDVITDITVKTYREIIGGVANDADAFTISFYAGGTGDAKADWNAFLADSENADLKELTSVSGVSNADMEAGLLVENVNLNFDADTDYLTVMISIDPALVPCVEDGNGVSLPANNLQFTMTGSTAAVPEPSTYAAIFGAIALGFVVYRRRK